MALGVRGCGWTQQARKAIMDVSLRGASELGPVAEEAHDEAQREHAGGALQSQWLQAVLLHLTHAASA